MKFSDEFAAYDVAVEKDEEGIVPPSTIEFHVRKFHAPYIEVATEEVRRVEGGGMVSVGEVLEDVGVGGRVRKDMEDHVKFQLERIRRLRRERGVGVRVRLDVRVMGEGVRRRRVVVVKEREVERRGERVEFVPARREAVEALEREVVVVGEEEDGEERECSICLKEVVEGVTVIKMPCGHEFHDKCVLKWLDRAHVCPFCRFQLPH